MAEVVEVDVEVLVERAQAGDLDALGHLHDRYRDRVAGFARARLGDPDKAEDVTSETFEAVLRRLGGYRPGTDFEAWLFTIAYRRVSDHFRRQHRRRDLVTLHEAPATDAAGSEEAALAAEDRTDDGRAASRAPATLAAGARRGAGGRLAGVGHARRRSALPDLAGLGHRALEPGRAELPHPEEVGGGRAEAALERERGVAARLAHPALRRLLDARLDHHPPYLVFEYVEGPTLDTVLSEEGRLHPADVAQVGLHLAAALRYLHVSGVVHLDVKPGNAVLRDGRVVLIDLGIARFRGQGPDPGRSLAGSPPWMAPEQIRNAPAAPAMDLFALGAVLYELATGEPAFEPRDRGPSERRHPQLHGRPAPVRTVVGSLPARLGRVIGALLEPDPATGRAAPRRCSPPSPRCRPAPPTSPGRAGPPACSTGRVDRRSTVGWWQVRSDPLVSWPARRRPPPGGSVPPPGSSGRWPSPPPG
jgi:RNA polymerase sigma factor (sigma-70 family)